MKKFILILLMLCINIALVGCSQDASKLLASANENMKNWSSYGFEMQTTADITVDHVGHVKLLTVSEAVATAEPFKMEMNSHITMESNEAPSQEVSLQQYLEELDNSLSLYQNSQGIWEQSVISEQELKNSLCRKPSDTLAIYLKSMQSAEIIGDETVNDIPCVKISVKLSANAINELLNSVMAAQYLDLSKELSFAEDLEPETMLWIGKKDSQIYKQELDLSPVLKELLSLSDTGEIPTDFSQVIMNMSILYYDINGIDTIIIPKEVKKNPA